MSASSSSVGRALLLVSFAAPLGSFARAQACGNDVVLNRLDAGVAGPELATPDGAPVVGGPFRLRVEGALPNTAGAMVFSPVEAPFFSADYGATFWFGSPFGTEFFVTDAQGRSPGLTVVPEVDPFFCNEFGIFQAGVFDATATGGVAVTNAIRLRVGDNGNFDFPLPRKHDSPSVLDVALGDFDEDGRDDVVSLVADPFRVELRLASDLDVTTTLPAGTGSQAAAVDDLDGDGHLDLAIANLGSDDVSILLGNGDGTFAGAVSYAVGDAPVSIAIAPFDGDAVLDVVVANLSSASLSFLAGNGDGTFQPATTLPVGSTPRHVVVGDWDGDRVSDLAVARGTSSLEVLTGNGDLTFDVLPSLSVIGTPIALSVGDFDEDSVPDLVALSFNAGEFRVFLGAGDGTFAAGVSGLTWFNSFSQPTDIRVGDADLDGHADLVIGNGAGPLTLHLGNGDGTFVASQALQSGGTQIELGDVNGDGRVDVVSGDASGLFVRRLAKNGPVLPPVANVAFPSGLSAADVTGDGLLDLVTANSQVRVFPGIGGGAFPSSTILTPDDIDGVETGDLDGDGVADIVGWGPGRVDVYRGGALTLAASLTSTPVSSVRIADASGDGLLDLVFIEEVAGQQRIALHRGNGDGTLGASNLSNIAAASTTELVLDDVNGDGVLDAVHEHFVTGEVAVRLGTGTGFFSTQIASPVGLDPGQIALGDFDGDSNLDLALTGTVAFGSGTFPSVNLCLGNGDGTFQAPTGLAAGAPRKLLVHDVDGDGLDDIVVEAHGQGDLHVFRNGGGASFTRATYALWDANQSGFQMLIRDVDDDGIPDLWVQENTPLFIPAGLRVFPNQLGE